MFPIYLSVIRHSVLPFVGWIWAECEYKCLPCEGVAGERGQEVEGGAGGAAGLPHQRDAGRVSACLSSINIGPAAAAGRD